MELPASLLCCVATTGPSPFPFLSFLSTFSRILSTLSSTAFSPLSLITLLGPFRAFLHFARSPLRHSFSRSWPRPILASARIPPTPFASSLILTWNRLVAVCSLVRASPPAYLRFCPTPHQLTTTCDHCGRHLLRRYSVNPQEVIPC